MPHDERELLPYRADGVNRYRTTPASILELKMATRSILSARPYKDPIRSLPKAPQELEIAKTPPSKTPTIQISYNPHAGNDAPTPRRSRYPRRRSPNSSPPLDLVLYAPEPSSPSLLMAPSYPRTLCSLSCALNFNRRAIPDKRNALDSAILSLVQFLSRFKSLFPPQTHQLAKYYLLNTHFLEILFHITRGK